jgi:RNA polymerase sigma-70 factor (ECF subfamily)
MGRVDLGPAMTRASTLLSQRPSQPTNTASLDERLVAELPALRAFVVKLAGSRTPSADVEDVAQEVVARALRYRGSFQQERALGPWLRTTAMRVFLDHRERGANAPQPIDGDARELETSHPRVGEDAERREELASMLERLDKVERDVLVRFHARSQSVREIAGALRMPEGTVKSHLHRARRKLARFSGNEGGR